MKKRKADEFTDNYNDIDSPHKKSRHKHKKHKKKRERTSSNSEEIDVVGFDMKKEAGHGFGSLKLKIKFGGETVSTTQFVPEKEKTSIPRPQLHHKQLIQTVRKPAVKQIGGQRIDELGDVDDDDFEDDGGIVGADNDEDDGVDEEFEDIEESEDMPPSNNGDSSHQGLEFDEFGDEMNDSDIISQNSSQQVEEDEESKWLDALESGELDDYGCLKKEKDVSLMTARQRALYGHLVEGETELLELPLWAKRRDENSEEAQLRRKQRAKKRKQQMQKQVEETKAQTIDKLLNKQATKGKKEQKAASKTKIKSPHIKYTNGKSGISISMSEGIEFPLKAQLPRAVPSVVKCSVEGCGNPKKYSCSRTKLPVCGLECYRTVQQLHQLSSIVAS